MSIVNLGNQYITWDYKHPATARDFNTVLREGIKPGIYKGGEITLLGGVEISIAPFVAYINSGVDKLVRVETRASITLSITESTPVLSITYAWSDVIENWLDFNQRASGSAPIENEIIFGEFTFSGGVITALDESEKTWGLQLTSNVDDGTTPMIIASTTKVDNLNADLLDGYHAGNASGQIPVSDTNLNIDLNADQVDGKDVQTTITYSDDYIPTSKAIIDYYSLVEGSSIRVEGSSIRVETEYIPISSEFPWFCLSNDDQDFTTTNYSSTFIDKLRARKYIHDEFGTSPVSAFSGTWAGNVFTLTDNAANNAMLAELAEDWLYHGSPLSNWRILNDGTTDFKITDIDTVTKEITVDLDSETATGISIIIYTNRVYRQATQARHFSEAGLATYQAGGGKSGRLFRRDQMQRITGSLGADALFGNDLGGASGSGAFSTTLSASAGRSSSAANKGYASLSLDSANSPNNRSSATTDGETIAKSSSRYEYIYVGSYTA